MFHEFRISPSIRVAVRLPMGTHVDTKVFVLSVCLSRAKNEKTRRKKNICPYVRRGGEEDDGGVHNDDDERAGASATNGEATWLIISGRSSSDREASKEPCRGRVPGASGVGAMGTGTTGPRELNARRVRTAGTGGWGGG